MKSLCKGYTKTGEIGQHRVISLSTNPSCTSQWPLAFWQRIFGLGGSFLSKSWPGRRIIKPF